MKSERVDPEPPATPEGASPVASALRALASCVEFLLTGGRRDVRRERQKLNEAQRLIADIESHEAAHGTAPATRGPTEGRGTRPNGGTEAA